MDEHTCIVDSCERPRYVRQMCTLHYQRWLIHGDAEYQRPLGWKRKSPPKKPPRYCSEDGCDRLVHAHGLCGKHGARRYYAAHREESLAANKRWRLEHREQRRDYVRDWHRAHPKHKRDSESRRRAAKHNGIMPQRIPAHLIAGKAAYWGHRCWVCGGPFEQMDHVKPLAKGGAHILANLRPICTDCNRKKHANWPLPELRRNL